MIWSMHCFIMWVGELQFIQECFDMDEYILIPSILQSWWRKCIKKRNTESKPEIFWSTSVKIITRRIALSDDFFREQTWTSIHVSKHHKLLSYCFYNPCMRQNLSNLTKFLILMTTMVFITRQLVEWQLSFCRVFNLSRIGNVRISDKAR